MVDTAPMKHYLVVCVASALASEASTAAPKRPSWSESSRPVLARAMPRSRCVKTTPSAADEAAIPSLRDSC
jgi:hypothetical protein